VTESAGQHRRGRKPLPAGVAKVKRNLRLGPVFDEAAKELRPGETMTHLVEEALRHEITRRKRSKRRTESEGASPVETNETPE
jgi:hypothetical protein